MKKQFLLQPLLILIFIVSSSAQKYISDTIVVPYKPHQEINVSFCFDTIYDLRENSSLITITEKKRYLFIPVDRYFMLPESLNSTLLKSVSKPDDDCKKTFSLSMEHLTISDRKNSIMPAQILNAKVDISEIGKDGTNKLGSLIYETELKKKEVKGKPEEKMEALIKKWNNSLANDLNTITYTNEAIYTTLLPNLKAVEFKYKKQLYTAATMSVGLDWYSIEGELYFAYPEVQSSFIQAPKTVKYRKMKNVESLEFGSINDHFCYQLNPSLKFDFATKLFIGINRWNDIETKNHKLEEILLLDISLNQTISLYNPDKKGLYGGIGLTEGFLYIIENPFMFTPGITFQIGIKL